MTVPAGWRATTLGALGRYLNGRAFKKAEWGSTGRPIIRIQNLTGSSESFNYFDGDVEERYRVPPGALLVSWAATLGAYFWNGPEGVLNQHIFKVESAINPRFHKYLLDFSLEELMRHTHGSGMVHITRSKFDGLPVAVPSEDEQQRIVEVIEEHLSHLDAADASLTLASRRAARLLAAGLWQATHELGGAVARMDQVAEVRLGRQRSPKNHEGDRMRPYLRAANVDWDRLRLNDVMSMNFTESEEAVYRLLPGDILLTEASGSPAEVGKSVLYTGTPEVACFQNTLIRVRPHEQNSEFVQKFLLAEAYAGRFMPESRGVGINHLGRSRLAALQISLPSQDQQRVAVLKCRSLSENLARLNGETSKASARCSALRRAVLAAAFSGRLTGASSDTDTIEELAEV